MQKTDYAALASRYDRGWYRLEIPSDPLVTALSSGSRVLDLACGTGSWLERQVRDHGDRGHHWTGVDASAEMLARAREKGIPADWHQADVHELPFFDGSFDLIKCRFAFHHFIQPSVAAAETFRVLRSGGLLSLENIAPEYQRASWVYTFFPDARAVDQERFLPVVDLVHLFEGLGLKVEAQVTVSVRTFGWDEILHEVDNRDMSQLTLISEDSYRRGREAIAWEAQRSPGFPGDMALLNLTAQKGS